MQRMNGPNTGAYISRPYRSGDEDALVQLYNIVTGRSRTLEQHRWEWLDTPEGRGSMWIIEETESGEIIGHHGLIPMRFRFFDQSILVGKTENSMVHPRCRGRIGYFAFETMFLDQARERYDLLFTNRVSGKPGRIRKGLGYVNAGSYDDYVKICSKEVLDQKAAARVQSIVSSRILQHLLTWLVRVANFLIFRLLFGRKVPTDDAVDLEQIKDIEEIAEELDSLWERSKSQYGITVNRVSRYLKWRIFDNPNVDYVFLVAKIKGKIIGYAAYEEVREGTVWLLDLIADGNDAKLLETLLGSIVQRLNDEGIFVVWLPTMRGKTTLTHALRRNGFRSFSAVVELWHRLSGKEVPTMVVKVLNDDLDSSRTQNPDCWYYTSILEEGRRRGGGD